MVNIHYKLGIGFLLILFFYFLLGAIEISVFLFAFIVFLSFWVVFTLWWVFMDKAQ